MSIAPAKKLLAHLRIPAGALRTLAASLVLLGMVAVVSGAFGQQNAIFGRHGQIELPDDAVTPGVIATTDLKTIVSTKWGKDVRHVTAKMKVQACLAYGIVKGCPGKGYELDHRVPRCAGGADDERNLWPQKAPEFHWKDRLETLVCKEIKQGKIGVSEAQAIFLGDWAEGYEKQIGPLPQEPK
jgi:hypothetical protein